MRIARAAAGACAALVLFAVPARAGAELTLTDGTVLSGTSLERKDHLYLLTTEDGEVVTVPVEQVKTFRLFDDPEAAPSAIKLEPPRTLSGPDPETPRFAGPPEQIAAFRRPPAAFRPDAVRSRWEPEDAFAGRDVTQFNPARWYRAPIDPTWTPTPALKNRGDVTHFNPARWYRPPIDPIWRPKDGFATSAGRPAAR